MNTTVPSGTFLVMAISLDTIERTRLYLVETLQVGDVYVDRGLNARFERTERGQWRVEVGAYVPAYLDEPEDAVAYAVQAAEREAVAA